MSAEVTALDKAFYKVAIQQRDSAWGEVENLKEQLRQAEGREEQYRNAIDEAVDYASGRWCEWGERAEGVRDILADARAWTGRVPVPPEEESELATTIRDAGFESEEEFHSMVAKVNLSTRSKKEEFKYWQHEDGTKSGLCKLLEMNNDG